MVFNERLRSVESNRETLKIRKLTWDDLLYIESHNIGLRKVYNEEAMRDEQENGFVGDALALSNVSKLVPDHFFPFGEQYKSLKKYRITPRLYHFIDKMPHRFKEKILDLFEKAVKEFIQDQFDSFKNYNTNPTDTVRQYVDGMLESSSFLGVAEDDSLLARDEEVYHGLGKFGRRRRQASDVVFSISASDIVREMCLTQEELKESGIEVLDKITERAVNAVYALLARRIESLRVGNSQ